MHIQIRLVHDSVTPHLRKIKRELSNPRPILTAMNQAYQQTVASAQRDQAIRKMPWPPPKGWLHKSIQRPLIGVGPHVWGKSINTISVSLCHVTHRKARAAAWAVAAKHFAAIMKRP